MIEGGGLDGRDGGGVRWHWKPVRHEVGVMEEPKARRGDAWQVHAHTHTTHANTNKPKMHVLAHTPQLIINQGVNRTTTA